MPKGQRPPPFVPPPTSVGCGGAGDSFGDDHHIQRCLNRYLKAVESISNLERWSIESLGVRSELEKQYKTLLEVAGRKPWEFTSNVQINQLLACSKYAELEDAYFADPDAVFDSISLSLEAGWIGSHEKQTPNILNEVRADLITTYREIRNRVWSDPKEDFAFAGEVKDRVNAICERLFAITGPDEIAWIDWIANLSEAALVIRERAISLAKT